MELESAILSMGLRDKMHRRHQHQNIPTEIVRTIVAIAETGSFSKAGEKLGLSQPAISAQVKRLQILVGGSVFERVAGGVTFTARGNMVLAHARKLLDANDQILSLGGHIHEGHPVRVGASSFYVSQLLTLWQQSNWSTPVNFSCDNSANLAKGMLDGYLDIACLLRPSKEQNDLAASWMEEFVWVRSANFVLSPGSPVPLIGWPGGLSDLPMVRALEKAGMAYRIVFACSEHHARVEAVLAGMGIMALPLRQFAPPLVKATEYYLPPLQPLRAGIAVRSGLDTETAKHFVNLMSRLGPEDMQQKSQIA
jgi:DNA-binding transcriptional LysR family regulator